MPAGNLPAPSFEGLDTLLSRFSQLIAMGDEPTVMGFTKHGALAYRAAVRREIRGRGLIDSGSYINGIQITGIERGAWAVWTDKIYAKVHEFGATITAKRGPYLIFQIDGQWVQVRSVTIPARPHWRPAMGTAKNPMIRDIAGAMRKRLGEIARG